MPIVRLMSKFRYAAAGCFLVAASSFFLLGCGGKSAANTGPSQKTTPPKRVAVVPVRQLETEETIYVTGSLAARDRAVLSAKTPGRLAELKVDIGSQVKKGDLLAQIETSEYLLKVKQAEAALAQARARLGLSLTGEDDEAKPENSSLVKEAEAVLKEAQRNRDRISALREQGVIPQAELDTVEAAFQVASNRFDEALYESRNRLAVLKERRAELELAGQELKDASIFAPFDGVIERRQASLGEFLKEAAPILTLVRVDPVRMRVEAPEKDAPRIMPGQKVYLQLENDSNVFTSEISRLSPVITEDNRMLIAEADFANPDGRLRPGAFVKARIVVNPRRPGLFVPSSSIVTFAGIQKVFAVKEGKATELEVETGVAREGLVEIAKGLKQGDTVISDPAGLRSGQLVEISVRDT